jgi:hypothetical protein
MAFPRAILLSLAAAMLVLSGCGSSGPKLVEVEGTVKLGGQPIDNISVEFWPEADGPRSIGVTDAQGKFSLTTDDGTKKGAVLGAHKVVLRDASVLGNKFLGRAGEDVDMTEGRKSRIAEIYLDPHKSPLKAEVTADKKPIEFDVQGPTS